MRSPFSEVWLLEKFKTTEATFKVTQGQVCVMMMKAAYQLV